MPDGEGRTGPAGQEPWDKEPWDKEPWDKEQEDKVAIAQEQEQWQGRCIQRARTGSRAENVISRTQRCHSTPQRKTATNNPTAARPCTRNTPNPHTLTPSHSRRRHPHEHPRRYKTCTTHTHASPSHPRSDLQQWLCRTPTRRPPYVAGHCRPS